MENVSYEPILPDAALEMNFGFYLFNQPATKPLRLHFFHVVLRLAL